MYYAWSIHNSGSLYLLMVVALSVTRSKYQHYSALQGVMGSQLSNGHSGHWQSEHLRCPTDHMILTTGVLGILTFVMRKRARRCFSPNIQLSECRYFRRVFSVFVVTKGGKIASFCGHSWWIKSLVRLKLSVKMWGGVTFGGVGGSWGIQHNKTQQNSRDF